MLPRISQLARHLSRPIPHYGHTSAFAAASQPSTFVRANTGFKAAMASSGYSSATADDNNRRKIHTAGCIIIGDEVLGGKTVDTNSAYMAKFCFSLGIALKRIEVIGDDEGEIMEAVRRMSHNYDFVCTSGGIGPTHDDITYASIAKAFGLPLTLHEGAFAKMKKLSKPHPSQPNFDWDAPSPALDAKKRMVVLPHDSARSAADQAVFVSDDLWVPVSVVNGNVHILPGVPRLFERLLEGMKAKLVPRLEDPEGKGVHRLYFSTPLAESAVASFLTELAAKTEPRGVKVGSYPRWGKARNTVTLVGRDADFMNSLIPEIEKGVNGRHVQHEGEDDEVETNKQS